MQSSSCPLGSGLDDTPLLLPACLTFLPMLLLVSPGIPSQINYLLSNPCLGVSFWGNLNQDSTQQSYFIS